MQLAGIHHLTDITFFDWPSPPERRGTRLSLPPFLEPDRATIEAGLKPL